MIKTLLLVTAVCADSFAAAVSIGADGIRLPLRSSAVISLTGTVMLCASAALAGTVGAFIPAEMCRAVSSILLTVLGIFCITRNYCGEIAEKSPAADSDGSRTLSPREALILSIALSADSAATGISAGLGGVDLPLLAGMTFAAGIVSAETGQRLGRKLRSALKINLSRLCGGLLIILAILNI